MFHSDFYPTPFNVIETMLNGINLNNKNVLEPQAGKGDIIDYCTKAGANVTACEINNDLQNIIASKCHFLKADFLQVESSEISHINYIVMNPPFSEDVKHIIHAYNIAPPGCNIISLCAASRLHNQYTNPRKDLANLVELYGSMENLGNCFSVAERQTEAEIMLIRLNKPGENYQNEFYGFFMDEETPEHQENGIMSYNIIRDMVNRYVQAVKIYDKQIETACELRNILHGFYGERIGFQLTSNDKPLQRSQFKKDLQKSAWNSIFNKMNMQKYATRGLKEDINKFIEQQQNVPFTMRNIYHMLDIIIQTHEQRIDKAIIEVFDKITAHHHDNKFFVPGWKTNSHFLVGKRFIFPYIGSIDAYRWKNNYEKYTVYRSDCETIVDFEKALCFVTGKQFDNIKTFYGSTNDNLYNTWYECEFFKYKAFKKGTVHFEFLDETIWGLFNQSVAKIKGYPLFEGKQQTDYQKKQTGRKIFKPAKEFKVMASYTVI